MSTSSANGPGSSSPPASPVVVETEYGPKIVGTRITVYDVYYYVLKGRSAERIAEILPLTVAQVRAVSEYITAHQEAVHAVHEQIEQRIARGHPPEVQAKLDAIHAKYAPIWAERRALGLEDGGEADPFFLV